MAYINFKEEKAKGKFQLDERKKNNEILYKSILKHKDSLTGFYPNLKYSFKKIIDENIGKKGVLGEEDFQLLVNIVVRRYTMLEAAEELGITVEACKKRVQRAKKKLQKIIEKEF